VGSVTEIVIDPGSRLVTHIGSVGNRYMDGRLEQKEALIRLDLVDLTREGAVWLKDGVDFRSLPVFDPAGYPLAPEGWKPPFPYEVGTVRWAKAAAA
jgi:hypothetical protein